MQYCHNLAVHGAFVSAHGVFRATQQQQGWTSFNLNWHLNYSCSSFVTTFLSSTMVVSLIWCSHFPRINFYCPNPNYITSSPTDTYRIWLSRSRANTRLSLPLETYPWNWRPSWPTSASSLSQHPSHCLWSTTHSSSPAHSVERWYPKSHGSRTTRR